MTGERKKENVPAFGVLPNGERSPRVTTALSAYGVFYCVGKLIIDPRRRDLKGFLCESDKKEKGTKKQQTEADCMLGTSNGEVARTPQD